jgi:HD-GYP domain-containing protein (c-di-GMP phosphodiesterase class II)
MPFMISFKRKSALAIGAVAVVLACLSGLATWLISRENGEDTIASIAVQESQRLLRDGSFQPQGPQAVILAQAAARALIAATFDIAAIYTAQGALMAEQMSPAGNAIEKDLAARSAPSYQQPFYVSQRLAGDRRILRLFVPLRAPDASITGYFEGVQVVPQWQQDLIHSNALDVATMVALAVLICGSAIFPVVLRLFAQSQRKTREVLESHLAMMQALGRAIARRDSDTGVHNYRVAWIAATLAEAVGLHGSRMQELIVGSFLHDVGKIGIPDSILLKPARLDDAEMAVMRTHVGLGEEIVTGAGWVDGGRAVVAGHHEKWDGTGYPRGLAGQDIALVARIFAIADVFDALCSRRPHKQPMPLPEVMQVLDGEVGKHFDPHLVKVFADLSADIYKTLLNASEIELRSRLERMVHKHFGL